MKNFSPETIKIALTTISFVGLLVIIYFIYRRVYVLLKRWVLKTPGKLDDFMLDLFKIPILWVLYWILIKIYSYVFLSELTFYSALQHISTLLLIFTFTWVAIKFVSLWIYFLQSKLDIRNPDNLSARKSLTQLEIFRKVAKTIIIIFAISISLLTFEQVRNIGVSLLTSAGIVGIIIGFAAQKTIGMILAGLQIAITQPIRIDDVVVVEGEWGRIEEITLTYVVVKIWDERRLVLPINWFLEHPFQNWTRTSSNILGTVFIYVDFNFPVESIRQVLPEMLKENPDWDGRVCNVQVTDVTQQYKEIRVLLSSSDSSKNWNLRVKIREQIIDYINAHHPDTFAKIRIQNFGGKSFEG
ncbi:MAG: mechanosensitive ion channel domain-containing protein [Bacteroidales bacterium]